MLESKFKTKLIKEIEERLPGSFVFHLDPREMQGAPDLLVLYKNHWGALEGKQHHNSSHQQNQDYYVDVMDKMSYAAFVNQENKEEILNELQQALELGRNPRHVRS